MSEIRGFITNLGKYNEGELVGEWIEFPIDDTELAEVLNRIGIDGREYEEYFFTDWELPEGMNWRDFGEYPDLGEVNTVAETFDAPGADTDVLSAIFSHSSSIQEALDIIEEGNFSVYYGADDTQSLGEIVVDELYGGVENLDKNTLEECFDYEAYGRSLETGGTILYFDGGAIELY